MIYNWTKHPITIRSTAGVVVNIPSSGVEARIRVTEKIAGATTQIVNGEAHEFALYDVTTHEIIGLDIKTGRLVELPALGDEDIAVVSGMIKDQVPNNPRIVSPNTGETAVRTDGRIDYVLGLIIRRVEG